MKKDDAKNSGKKTLNSAFLLILVVAVVAVSGCIANFPFAQQASLVNPTVTVETQDLVLKAEAVPLEVRSGKRLDLFFEIDALKDLKGLSFAVTDACLFSGELGGFDSQELKEERSKDFKLSLTAGSVDFDTDCQIRFMSSYSAELMATQDIIVLDESEFLDEQRNGKISERQANFVSTDNPLRITFSFSSQQPFEDKTDEFMYIEYSNTGSGNLEKLSKGSVQFTAPNNVKISCDDYTAEGSKFTLDRDLVFTGGRAKKSACKMTTGAQQPVDFKNIQLTANYLYTVDNFINVKIKRK
ncbi:MAG: hypothetical protein WA139_00415 [Candidatus Aenigmatarchaeota archaeon]